MNARFMGLGVLVLAFGLGCSGMGEAISAMSGMEVKTGADAEVPAGFVIPAPDDGVLQTVATMPMAGKKMTTVAWQVQDTDAAKAQYRAWFSAQGIEVQEQTQDLMGMKQLTLTAPDGATIVTITEQSGQKSVTAISTQ